jgi:2-keto-3-deoxy-galactonokinase
LNLLLMPGEHLLWSDVADGTVQANVVVMLHITLYQAPCIFQRSSN